MRSRRRRDGRPNATLAAVALLLLGALRCLPAAAASNLLGLYVGAGAGRAEVRATGFRSPPSGPLAIPLGALGHPAFAYQLTAGVRFLEVFGAEADYVDLGHASEAIGPQATAGVGTSGTAVFGVFYLPIPVVNVFAKAGLARLDTQGNASVGPPGVGRCAIGLPSCDVYSSAYRQRTTSLAAGIGAQVDWGPLAVRAEVERFSAAGEHPSLAAIELLFRFL
ncbi:MAG: outer membrane beta-barrel protein [Gammaproteobacteria bacterium]|nr:outer membrane beta-barrel protein [Gammaproteobacteria bacterium]